MDPMLLWNVMLIAMLYNHLEGLYSDVFSLLQRV